MQFLKFNSEAEFLSAFSAHLVNTPEADAQVPAYIGNSAVDVVGEIWKPTGKYETIDGMRTPKMTKLPGWHVNLSGDCPPELEAYLIAAPVTPSRVFA